MFFRCSQFFFKIHLHFLFLNIYIFCFGCARSLLWCTGFIVVACGLSCPKACGILSPGPGMEPASSALEGRFLTTGPPRKMSLTYILVQNISTLVWQQNGLNYLSSNNFFLKNLSEYWPPVARGASFRRWGTASHVHQWQGLSTHQDARRSKTPDTHNLLAHHRHAAKKHVVQRTRDPQVVACVWWSHVKSTRRASQDLLTLGFSALLVSSPVHHGRIRDGQFAIVLLPDHWPPSSRHEDSWGERGKNPTM